MPNVGGGFQKFLYGRKNLGWGWDFFLKKPYQIEEIFQIDRSFDNQPPPPEYAPAKCHKF